MNLIDAIKSGRPFRRPEWGLWWKKIDHGDFCENDENQRCPGFSPDDVLADDWEIQEQTVTITPTQFWEAWNIAMKEEMGERCITLPASSKAIKQDMEMGAVGRVAKLLGLAE